MHRVGGDGGRLVGCNSGLSPFILAVTNRSFRFLFREYAVTYLCGSASGNLARILSNESLAISAIFFAVSE